MMLLVQEYLKHNSLSDLMRDHAVKARVVGHKASFNYDQIEAKDDDPVAQQCRGLILSTADGSPMPEEDPVGETCILAHPFYRFFNLGQGAAAPVDMHHPETAIFEKLDGTLCIVYFDPFKNEWHVATRAVAEADLPVNGWEQYTFRTLFEKGLEETLKKGGVTFSEWTSVLSKDKTYMFELCTPMNQVVVAHTDYRVTLLGARITETGEELWPDQVKVVVPHVHRHRFGHVDEMLEFVRERDPRQFEGVVCCQEVSPGRFIRVKIKNAQYLAYSRLKDAISSPRNVMTLILGGNLDDAFVVMPEEMQKQALGWQEKIQRLLHDYRVQYDTLLTAVSCLTGTEPGSKEHRKAFALTAQKVGIWFEPAMAQYSGKTKDALDFIEQKKGPNGDFQNSFLDYLLKVAGT